MTSLQIEHQRLSNLIDELYQLRNKLIYDHRINMKIYHEILNLTNMIGQLEVSKSNIQHVIDSEEVMTINDLWQRCKDISRQIGELQKKADYILCEKGINEQSRSEVAPLRVQINNLNRERNKLEVRIDNLLDDKYFILLNGNILTSYEGNVFEKEKI